MAANPIRIFAVAAKLESPSGTDAVPTLAVNAIRVIGIPLLNLAPMESGERTDAQHAGLGEVGRAAAVGRVGTIDIAMEAFGKGSAYTTVNDAFQPDPFLLAGAFTKAFAAGAINYTTLDVGVDTITLYLWGSDGNLYKLIGCVTKPKLALVAGKPGVLTFACEGRLVSVPAAYANLSGLALPATIPGVWAGAAVLMGAWTTSTSAPNALAPRKLDIDLGTVTTSRPWAGAGGLIGHAVVDRSARLDMDVEVVALTTFDPFARAMEPMDAAAVDTKVSTSIPGGIGNVFSIVTGQVALEQPKPINLGGLAGWGLGGKLVARSIPSGVGVGREIALSIA